MIFLRKLLAQVHHQLKDMTTSQRLVFGLLASLMVVATVWLTQWSGRTEYIPLLDQPFAPALGAFLQQPGIDLDCLPGTTMAQVLFRTVEVLLPRQMDLLDAVNVLLDSPPTEHKRDVESVESDDPDVLIRQTTYIEFVRAGDDTGQQHGGKKKQCVSHGASPPTGIRRNPPGCIPRT